jgi:hypothetical protein
MTSRGSRLVVVAVAVLVVVAAVDAIRNRDGAERSQRRAFDPELVDTLRRAGVRGTLVYTDSRCDVRALRLPELRRVKPPEGPDVGCELEVSPDGRRVASARAVWQPSSGAYAVCFLRTVDVRAPPGSQPIFAYDGCAPAWKPSGVLTVAREETVLEVRPTCSGQPPCERVLLTRDQLRDAAPGHPSAPSDRTLVASVDVQSAAWLSSRRLVLLLRLRLRGRFRELGPLQLVASFDGSRLGWTRPRFDDDAVRLQASPTRRYVVLEPGEILHADGSQLSLPARLERGVRAWSPDGRRLAVATGESVAFVRTADLERFDASGRAPPTIAVPLRVRDLAWRRAGTVRR